MKVFSLSELAGKTPEENAEIYSMVDCIEDLWQHIAAMFREQDEAIKVRNNNWFPRPKEIYSNHRLSGERYLWRSIYLFL